MTITTATITTATNITAASEPEYGVFERTARFIGDLDHELYDDTAQGNAWNEASAIGFQMMLIGALIGSGLMFLFGDASAIPYASAMIGFVGVASLSTITYASAKGVDVSPRRSDFLRPRGVVALGGIGLHIAAVVRHGGTDAGFAIGFGVAVGAGLVLGLVGRLMMDRRS